MYDAALSWAQEHQVAQEPYAFPGGLRFHFRDPAGNELGVWAAE